MTFEREIHRMLPSGVRSATRRDPSDDATIQEATVRPGPTTISLTVPASPSSIAIVRTVAATVAGRLEVPYDTVDDLRIAVAEACNRILTSAPHAAELRLDVEWDEASLVATVSTAVSPGDQPPEHATAWEWRIIEGLTDHASEALTDGRLAIELRIGIGSRVV
jgi:serine/threonine-protein kinase RsbW